jgi:hypothetical protein
MATASEVRASSVLPFPPQGRIGKAARPGPSGLSGGGGGPHGGGGDGTYDDMRERVAKLDHITDALQKGFERVEKDVRGMSETLARVDTRLGSVATSAEMATALGKIETVSAKLDDKVSTRAAYAISILMAGLIVAAALGGVGRLGSWAAQKLSEPAVPAQIAPRAPG